MRRVKFHVLHLHRFVLISLHDLFCELFEESLGLLISTSIFEVRFSGYNSRSRVVARYLEDVWTFSTKVCLLHSQSRTFDFGWKQPRSNYCWCEVFTGSWWLGLLLNRDFSADLFAGFLSSHSLIDPVNGSIQHEDLHTSYCFRRLRLLRLTNNIYTLRKVILQTSFLR